MAHGKERQIVLGEHFYQPPRKGAHQRVQDIQTDPGGVDWNERIARESYVPQIRKGILDHTSFDFYTTMRQEMEEISPGDVPDLEGSLKDRGVGDPFLHVLLPDLSYEDKYILIEAGKRVFEEQTGQQPSWFWAPETALDMETLDVLSECGYIGVICAPEQIDTNKGEVDNRPVKISLYGGGEMLLLSFDRPVSSSLAFDAKDNADRFANDVVAPRFDNLPDSLPMVAWTDGETFGHHSKFGDHFLQHLVETSLPEAGIAVLGINQITEIWGDDDFIEGSLDERSAWSCPHGDLQRWHGPCPCDNGFNGEWKSYFMGAVTNLNDQITSLLERVFNGDYAEELVGDFDRAFSYEGDEQDVSLSLLAAKASSLAAMTSCGTFFDGPRTSGRINMLFARQALEHLVDAGYRDEAEKLLNELIGELLEGIDPHSNLPLNELFDDILVLSD
jgi:hypothetical protein